eukprot:scaffold19110_cov17-Prasinocladus_malaysianus.AAC.3
MAAHLTLGGVGSGNTGASLGAALALDGDEGPRRARLTGRGQDLQGPGRVDRHRDVVGQPVGRGLGGLQDARVEVGLLGAHHAQFAAVRVYGNVRLEAEVGDQPRAGAVPEAAAVCPDAGD